LGGTGGPVLKELFGKVDSFQEALDLIFCCVETSGLVLDDLEQFILPGAD
jgi:hypothetical protein